MARTRLSITLPDGVWIEEVSTAHSEADFNVLAAMPGDGEDAGFGVVRRCARPTTSRRCRSSSAAKDGLSSSSRRPSP